MAKTVDRLGMYADLQPILDAALAAGGGTYTLETYGQAVHWVQRAYKFRKLFAEIYATKSKYDLLTMPRIVPGTSTVIIKVNKPSGVFEPAGDGPVTEEIVDEDLLDFAASLAKKVGGRDA